MNILELCQQPESKRDEKWESEFFELFPKSQLTILNPEPQQGPDKWPYLLVKLEHGSTEPTIEVLSWLAERGIGLAVNPHKQMPDYIFTYGMLWLYKQHGQFAGNVKNSVASEFSLSPGQKVYTGEPSQEYLPDYVRVIIREFLKQQQVNQPKVIMLSADNKNYDLCFSLESLGEPPESEHKGILEALSWFLPQHYSLALVSEKELKSFKPL